MKSKPKMLEAWAKRYVAGDWGGLGHMTGSSAYNVNGVPWGRGPYCLHRPLQWGLPSLRPPVPVGYSHNPARFTLYVEDPVM